MSHNERIPATVVFGFVWLCVVVVGCFFFSLLLCVFGFFLIKEQLIWLFSWQRFLTTFISVTLHVCP